MGEWKDGWMDKRVDRRVRAFVGRGMDNRTDRCMHTHIHTLIDHKLAKGRFMEKEMPNAALVVFEGDDHFAYFNQANRFNLVLEAFLRRDYDIY